MTFPKVIIFDFDGIILESNNLKDIAFQNLFKDYPQYFDEIKKYQMTHPGTHRFALFKHIKEEILKGDAPNDLEKIWAQRYQDETRSALMKCPFVEGAEELLQWLKKNHTSPLYIASATPQTEIDWIIQNRNLLNYFKEIFGAPTPKSVLLSDILKKESLPPSDALFIGDADQDWKASEAAQIPFVGRRGKSQFSGAPFPVFDNLIQIRNYLEGLNKS